MVSNVWDDHALVNAWGQSEANDVAICILKEMNKEEFAAVGIQVVSLEMICTESKDSLLHDLSNVGLRVVDFLIP